MLPLSYSYISIYFYIFYGTHFGEDILRITGSRLPTRFFSVMDDLHAFYKQPEKNFVSIMTSQQAFELAVNLWTTFCNARDNYLTLCQVSFCPPALEYPFLFFYRHPSNGSIHTVYSYPYELSKKATHLV